MTESEWLASTDPQAMLTAIDLWNHTDASRAASDRKLRLFACACVRQVWHLLTDERSRKAVEVTERYADGKATEVQMVWAGQGVDPSASDVTWLRRLPESVCEKDIVWPQFFQRCTRGGIAPTVQANLLRDIVGNPFRPVTLPKQQIVCPECRGKGDVRRAEIYASRYDRETCGTCHGDKLIDGPCPWLTPTVLAIAQSAYDERREDGTFDPVTLGILADALADSGCDCEPIFEHLRSGGVHVRGCWAVDLVLGKS